MSDVFLFDENPEFTENVKDSLKIFLGLTEQQFSTFCKILSETGSAIAGGFILGVIHDFKSYDIDIYTDENGAKLINDFFIREKIVLLDQEISIAPAYDDSFFRKNKINSRIYYRIDKDYEDDERKGSIDVMIIDPSSNPLQVVSNFDLTFCQVFFDGERVLATHPRDVLDKSGSLNEDYIPSLLNFNKFIVKRIQKYKQRGFTIKCSSDNTDVLIEKSKKTVESLEEWLVKKIYINMLTRLSTSLLYTVYNDKSILELLGGTSNLYLNYFNLKEYTVEALFELLEKVIDSECLLPGWIRFYYKKDDDMVYIMRILLLYRGELSMFVQYLKDGYKDYTREFLKTHLDFYEEEEEDLNDELDSHESKYRRMRNTFNSSYPKVGDYYDKLNALCLLKKELERKKQISMLIRRKEKTRNLDSLNRFINPIDINTIEFEEKKMVDESKGCQDILTQGIYNINAYLKGEAVEAYDLATEERDESLDLEPVSEEEARDRLVFFLSKRADNQELVPYCYSLEQLEHDIRSQVFVKCEGETMRNIINYLGKPAGNPIVKIDLGTRVFVPISQLLGALYKTKKQVFVLTPTDEVYEYTASLDTVLGGSYVSADHCQAGSDKRIYTITACEGKEDNLCYPIMDSIETMDINVPNMNQKQSKKIKEHLSINYAIDKLQSEVDRIYEELEGVIQGDYKDDYQEYQADYQYQDDDQDDDIGDYQYHDDYLDPVEDDQGDDQGDDQDDDQDDDRDDDQGDDQGDDQDDQDDDQDDEGYEQSVLIIRQNFPPPLVYNPQDAPDLEDIDEEEENPFE